MEGTYQPPRSTQPGGCGCPGPLALPGAGLTALVTGAGGNSTQPAHRFHPCRGLAIMPMNLSALTLWQSNELLGRGPRAGPAPGGLRPGPAPTASGEGLRSGVCPVAPYSSPPPWSRAHRAPALCHHPQAVHLLLQDQHIRLPTGRLLAERLQPVSAHLYLPAPHGQLRPGSPHRALVGPAPCATLTLLRRRECPALGAMPSLARCPSAAPALPHGLASRLR